MKQIKVYLNHPFGRAENSYYMYLLNNPPKNVDYINKKDIKTSAIDNQKALNKLKTQKKFLRFLAAKLAIPSITKQPRGDYDLIHCAHCLNMGNKPWVVDFEYIWSLTANVGIREIKKKHIERLRKILKNPNCKKLLPWTKKAEKTIYNWFEDQDIRKKVEVLYPSIPLTNFKKIKNKKTTLLFVGRHFYDKGGDVAIKVFDELQKKYDIECIVISQVPKNLIKRYPKIEFHTIISQEKLFKDIFPRADIFVYPGFMDSFGFILIEAMNFQLPIVTVDGFARREIVKDEKTGFIVNDKQNREEIIKDIIKKTEILIKNEKLREKMGVAGRKEVINGKFSLKKRNQKLKEIYQEALQ